ncbi:hypothetical protein ACJJTC_001423 [Scirpophaga incertulas]
MSDPLDPGGGDWGDADSSPPLFSPLTDTDVENPSSNSRKRGPSDQNSVLPSKKTSLVQATASIQSTYVCPDLNKNKYSENDSAPFIPHDGSSCSQVTPTCLLCLGNHRANNPICPEHHRQKQLKIIMSQENITYSEASVRVPRVRKSFTDTVRSGFIEPVPSDSSLPPSTQPSPSIPTNSSYRKTIYVTKNLPKSAASPGYDRQALSNIVRSPSFQSPDGHCLQNGNHRQDNNDHFIEMLLASAISILSRFDDIELPYKILTEKRRKSRNAFDQSGRWKAECTKAVRNDYNSARKITTFDKIASHFKKTKIVRPLTQLGTLLKLYH